MANAMGSLADDNTRKSYDQIITDIVEYAYDFEVDSSIAWDRAKTTLLDAMGAAFESLHCSPDCARMIRPSFPGEAIVSGGFRLPGTSYQLDVQKGAFALGSMIRFLDHNDAFPGAEWGHPSDNLGAILATADVVTRAAVTSGEGYSALTMEHVLTALIKAYEIQGCFQIKNAFNKVGLDHVILVKVASTAMVSWLLSLSKDQAKAAVSHAWMDGHPLRVYRQAPNAGPRKGWAGGDACMRAVHLALLVKAGQPGARTALTTPKWGFYDVLFKGGTFDLPRPFGTWVIENVIFKVNTAEGHGMTAVEAALKISNDMKQRGLTAKDIATVRVRTIEAAMIIINKQGPLHNAADRDHCLKYMVAVVFSKGSMVDTEDYQDTSPWASDPEVEALREKITMVEDLQFTRDYHNPEIRSISNAVQVQLKDGILLDEVTIKYPQGHVLHAETPELVHAKAKRNLSLKLPAEKVGSIVDSVYGPDFLTTPVSSFIDMFAVT